jgi:hypothetical protein
MKRQRFVSKALKGQGTLGTRKKVAILNPFEKADDPASAVL